MIIYDVIPRLALSYINICFVLGVLSLMGFNGFCSVRQVYPVNTIGFKVYLLEIISRSPLWPPGGIVLPA